MMKEDIKSSPFSLTYPALSSKYSQLLRAVFPFKIEAAQIIKVSLRVYYSFKKKVAQWVL